MKTFSELRQNLTESLNEETTKHSHNSNFGKHVEGCPRCHELKNGHAPIKWKMKPKDHEQSRSADIKAHFDSHKHRSGGCGPVCTYGEW
jgi:hypothetical protein